MVGRKIKLPPPNYIKKINFPFVSFPENYNEEESQKIAVNAKSGNLFSMFSVLAHNQAVIKSEILKNRKLLVKIRKEIKK